MRPKPLKEEICYAHFPCADFPGGTRHGSPVQPAAPATDHRHALHRNPARPLCPGAAGPVILAISVDLRQMALIIILIKAGLSLDLGDLRRVGRPAVLMSFLPASFEILAYILFAPMLLGITRLEAAVVMILLALCVRAVGVLLALAGTRLDWKERLFCVIAYLPKATVQAAIGSVLLAMGLPCGALVLSVAVLAILITAPLGAIGIDSTCRRLLRPAD